jgi:hypothetical protein
MPFFEIFASEAKTRAHPGPGLCIRIRIDFGRLDPDPPWECGPVLETNADPQHCTGPF